MLANTIDGYRQHEKHLISEFQEIFGVQLDDNSLNKVDGGIVYWEERCQPRKFVISSPSGYLMVVSVAFIYIYFTCPRFLLNLFQTWVKAFLEIYFRCTLVSKCYDM